MTNKKPLIFVTNDDGYKARGIKLLVDILKPMGEVVVVAPQTEMSGKSHSITAGLPLRLTEICIEDSYKEYALEGTPVDCVKMGFDNVLKRRPDFLFAGINHGANTSINTIYSGTMAAAMEGCAENVPSVGFSLCDNDKNAPLDGCLPFVEKIIKEVMTNGLNDGVCLNVNFPTGKIKGIKVGHQAKGYWTEEFDKTEQQNGSTIYWLGGEYHCTDKNPDADWNAVSAGYASVVPMQVDFTAWRELPQTKQRFENL
ncbi:MAG: 5'/3'-nucleotidase SurE [Bacteroidales bacterium]|nr:5'/3'-nucleotidase SurE [Bacteroidales bacterium]MBQ7985053.1 5'/3'-nucleotidase SurE [Bacteroidales bacterium]